MFRSLIAILLLVLPSYAQTDLRKELGKVVEDVKKFLDSRNEDSIMIGQFPGAAHLNSSAGPAIAQILAEEFKAAGVNVKATTTLAIEGRYKDVMDKQSKSLAAEFKYRIVDRQDNEVLSGSRGIFGDSTLSKLFGATVEYPPAGSTKERSAAIEKAIDKPAAHVKDTRVAAAAGSPYSIEVMVKKPGGVAAARAPESKDGLAFIPIARGEVYEIRLHNDSPHDAAVSLSIDGLNMFAFSNLKNAKTREPQYSFVLVGAKKSATIKGWHRDNLKSEEFEVTEYAKSAAAELKSSANVGTITATFAAAWAVRAQPPADEPTTKSEYARLDATGRGSKIESKYEEVEREVGVVRASVSVRYSR